MISNCVVKVVFQSSSGFLFLFDCNMTISLKQANKKKLSVFPFLLHVIQKSKTVKKQMENNASACIYWKLREINRMRRILIKMNTGNFITVHPVKTEIKMQILKILYILAFVFFEYYSVCIGQCFEKQNQCLQVHT